MDVTDVQAIMIYYRHHQVAVFRDRIEEANEPSGRCPLAQARSRTSAAYQYRFMS
jgi:hypothetical protein